MDLYLSPHRSALHLTFTAKYVFSEINGSVESRPFSSESVEKTEEKPQKKPSSTSKQTGGGLLMNGKACVQQGQCLDNVTQMGQEELSILECYVTPSAVIAFRPCTHMGGGLLLLVIRDSFRGQSVFVFRGKKISAMFFPKTAC